MTYSLVGLIAIFVHLIVNFDVFILRKKKEFQGRGFYLAFLLAVIAYHVTDALWGFLFEAQLKEAVIADTIVYFIVMAASILLWGFFVYRYLGVKGNRVIMYLSATVFLAQVVMVLINIFTPFIFSVYEEGGALVYKVSTGRYIMLTIQIIMYFILAVYTFASVRFTKGSLRHRYLAIALFSLLMLIAITLQAAFPLQPMYSIGFLAGVTALHTFVVEDEISNQRHELEAAQTAVLTDPLTGVKSKHAYIDYETEIDKRIDNGTMEDFSVVVFDLNDLKGVNDTFGHEAGDEYIIKSCKLIAETFKDIPIYRVGGDEFTIVLTNDAYLIRDTLMDRFNHRVIENIKKRNPIVIAAGISDFVKGKDTTILQVFTRADSEMYKCKNRIKNRTSSTGADA